MKFGAILGSASTAVAFVLSVGVAQAADTGGSEYFHQSGAGVSELTPRFSYINGVVKTNVPNTSDYKTNGIQNLGVEYEYGFSDMIAGYGNIGYGSVGVDNGGTATASGLNDINLGVKGTSAMGMGSLRFGLNLALGIEKAKYDGGDRRSNVASGGLNFTPYIGYDMAAGPGMWGARLSYTYMLDRSVDHSSYNTTLKGGDVLGLGTFYEFTAAEMIFGGRLQYDIAQDTKVTGRSGFADTSGPSGNMFTIGVYTRIQVGPGQLLAGLDYAMLAGNKPSGVDSAMQTTINAGYRITF